MAAPSEADRGTANHNAAVVESGSTDVPSTPAERDHSPSLSEAEAVIEVVEETARVEKRVVETGRVRVSTRTETTEQILRETLHGDAVEVTRVPIDRVIADGETAPQIRNEGVVMIIPVLEEVLVVEKRLVLKEEVHIRHAPSDENVEVPVTLRRQRAVIERVSLKGEITETLPVERDT